MNRLDDPFSIFAMTFTAITFIAMFVVVGRMYSTMRQIEENYDRDLVRRRSRQMLIVVGVWQVSIGLFLIAFGNAANSWSLIVIGVLMVVAAHYGWFTGEWLEKRRPHE